MMGKKTCCIDELMVGRRENFIGFSLIDLTLVTNYMCIACKVKKQV